MSFALHSRLVEIKNQELEYYQLQVSPYVNEQLNHMISIGVERMVVDRVVDKQRQVMLAEENLKRLIEFLAEQMKAYGTYPVLHDLGYDMAMADCFPLWPYI